MARVYLLLLALGVALPLPAHAVLARAAARRARGQDGPTVRHRGRQ